MDDASTIRGVGGSEPILHVRNDATGTGTIGGTIGTGRRETGRAEPDHWIAQGDYEIDARRSIGNVAIERGRMDQSQWGIDAGLVGTGSISTTVAGPANVRVESESKRDATAPPGDATTGGIGSASSVQYEWKMQFTETVGAVRGYIETQSDYHPTATGCLDRTTCSFGYHGVGHDTTTGGIGGPASVQCEWKTRAARATGGNRKCMEMWSGDHPKAKWYNLRIERSF